MNPPARERSSRDTQPQPARRHPATPCKAAQPPPPPAMKRLALLLPLLAETPSEMRQIAEWNCVKSPNENASNHRFILTEMQCIW